MYPIFWSTELNSNDILITVQNIWFRLLQFTHLFLDLFSAKLLNTPLFILRMKYVFVIVFKVGKSWVFALSPVSIQSAPYNCRGKYFDFSKLWLKPFIPLVLLRNSYLFNQFEFRAVETIHYYNFVFCFSVVHSSFATREVVETFLNRPDDLSWLKSRLVSFFVWYADSHLAITSKCFVRSSTNQSSGNY